MALNDTEIKGIVRGSALNNRALKHYGVRGMHWGTKKGKTLSSHANAVGGTGVKNAVKTVAKGTYNNLRHPIHSTVQTAKMNIKHPIFSQTSQLQTAKIINKRVENAIARKKKKKAAQKKSWQDYKKEAANVGGTGIGAGAKAGAVGLKNATTHYKTTVQEATKLRRENGRNYSKGGGVAAQKILNDRVKKRLAAQRKG